MDDKLINMDKNHSGRNRNDLIVEIIELTTRVDERVKAISETHLDVQNQLDEQLDLINVLIGKTQVIESQLDDVKNVKQSIRGIELQLNLLENNNTNQEHRWKAIFGFSVQLIWVLIASYILYKLGIQSPPLP